MERNVGVGFALTITSIGEMKTMGGKSSLWVTIREVRSSECIDRAPSEMIFATVAL
jgi:hypothetical protein